jgi:hypothetical protein
MGLLFFEDLFRFFNFVVFGGISDGHVGDSEMREGNGIEF